MRGREHGDAKDESLTVPAWVAVIVSLVSCTGFVLTVVGVLGCATVAAIVGEMPDVPIDVYVLVMVSLLWPLIVLVLCGVCAGFDIPRVVRILLDAVMIVLTIAQFSCVGIAAYRMVVANLPEVEPEIGWSYQLPESRVEREKVPEHPESVRVDIPEQCPTGEKLVVAEADDGWNEWLYVDPFEQKDYARRCRIRYLWQHYDGKRLTLHVYQSRPEWLEGD